MIMGTIDPEEFSGWYVMQSSTGDAASVEEAAAATKTGSALGGGVATTGFAGAF